MFKVVSNQLKEPVRQNTQVKADFAISFSRLPDSSMLICKHEISNDSVIERGVPIPFSALCDAVDAVKDEMSGQSEGKEQLLERCWTNNVLFESNSLLIWSRPATNRVERIWFRMDGGMCIPVKLPTLVFAFYKKSGELKIFASTSKTVVRKTALYHAPLCNVGSQGNLCFGTADRPDGFQCKHSIIETSEKAVLDTMFSHVNHQQTFAKVDGGVSTGDHVKIWQHLSKMNVMPKAKDLVKTSLTVEKLVGVIQ